jgi:hypothetical protein
VVTKRPLTYQWVKKTALELPEVAESTSYGTQALKVRGKLMIRLKEDGETLVVLTTWEERERCMMVHPEAFYFTEHYRRYPWVLVRLAAVDRIILRQSIEHAWALAAPKSLLKLHATAITKRSEVS